MGFSFKKALGPIAAAVNPVALLGTATQMGGDIYSANQQARAVEKANATNKEIAYGQMNFSSLEAEKARTFSAAQAKEQMDFQERMSNTQYQRATSDMRAAGINPMFAMDQGGAGTPGGAMGSAPMASSAGTQVMPVPSVMAHVMSSAKDLVSMYSTLRQAYANVKNTDADTIKKIVDTQKSKADTNLSYMEQQRLGMSLTRLERALNIEGKSPRLFGVMDALEERLGLLNSALSIFGRGRGYIYDGRN